MGRGKKLKPTKIGKLSVLLRAKKKASKISIAIDRSRHAVSNYLSRIKTSGNRSKNCRRTTDLTKRVKQLFCKDAATGKYSMRQVQDSLKLDVRVEIVQMFVQKSSKLVYCKPLHTSRLTT